MKRHYVVLFTSLALLAGCDASLSEGPATPATATGQFKDGNTEGLAYTSGSVSGVTDSLGRFTYQVGSPVTFRIGGLALGTAAAGKAVITPADLVPAGAPNPARVQNNIVRLLMALDANADPSDGITIPPAVQSAAAAWSGVDFGAADIATDTTLTTLLAAAGILPAWPSTTAASNHFLSTRLCTYAGAYRGTFSGSASGGTFGLVVDARDGNVTGIAHGSDGTETRLAGSSPLDFGAGAAFASNSLSGAAFSGHFISMDALSGQWAAGTDGGSFQGSRVGGALNAVYRYTGIFSGDDSGLFTVDVDGSGNVTGVAHNIAHNSTDTLSGTVATNVLSLHAGRNPVTISGTIDVINGDMNGTWVDSSDNSNGTFTGSGCRLN